jgi:hypothetical protein
MKRKLVFCIWCVAFAESISTNHTGRLEPRPLSSNPANKTVHFTEENRKQTATLQTQSPHPFVQNQTYPKPNNTIGFFTQEPVPPIHIEPLPPNQTPSDILIWTNTSIPARFPEGNSYDEGLDEQNRHLVQNDDITENDSGPRGTPVGVEPVDEHEQGHNKNSFNGTGTVGDPYLMPVGDDSSDGDDSYNDTGYIDSVPFFEDVGVNEIGVGDDVLDRMI